NCRMNCLWEDFRKVEPILKIVVRDQLDANVALGISPFISQFTLDPQTQMLIHQGLAKRNKAAHHLIYQEHPTEIKGKMKIGYISPDFNGHVVGFLIQDYFELHDHDQFEIYAYSLRNI